MDSLIVSRSDDSIMKTELIIKQINPKWMDGSPNKGVCNVDSSSSEKLIV